MPIGYSPLASSTPLPRRRGRIGPVATASVCHFLVHRKLGDEDDVGQVNRPIRRAVERLGAVCVHTVPCVRLMRGREVADRDGYKWTDTYRVHLSDSDSLALVREVCESAGIHDGPFYGCGKVTESPGSAPALPSRKRSVVHREKVREVERFAKERYLIRLLFGAEFPAESVFTLPDTVNVPCDDFGGRSYRRWQQFTSKWKEFPLVYNWLSREYARSFADCMSGGDEGHFLACQRWQNTLSEWMAYREVEIEEREAEREKSSPGAERLPLATGIVHGCAYGDSRPDSPLRRWYDILGEGIGG